MYSTKGFQDNMHLAETDKDKRIFEASEAAEQKKEAFYALRESARQEKERPPHQQQHAVETWSTVHNQ
jgi:hypothetical protein